MVYQISCIDKGTAVKYPSGIMGDYSIIVGVGETDNLSDMEKIVKSFCTITGYSPYNMALNFILKPEVIDDINRILNHVYNDEKKDYEYTTEERKDGHIFNSIKRLREYMGDVNLQNISNISIDTNEDDEENEGVS